MKRLLVLLVVASFLACSSVAYAVAVGTLSFDVSTPGPGGENAFAIGNFTGDPAAGGFALPPVFPATDALAFKGSSLALVLKDGTSLPGVVLGDIGAGPFDDPVLHFLDTTEFLSATFMATLSPASFHLDDGSTFSAFSLVKAVLTSASGPLVPSVDTLVVLEATPRAAAPEPWSWALVATGLAGLWAARRRR